jgi:hypothetical protein
MIAMTFPKLLPIIHKRYALEHDSRNSCGTYDNEFLLFGGLHPPYILSLLPRGLFHLPLGKAWLKNRMDTGLQVDAS